MNRLLRAASFAVASFTFVFGAPSMAWELTGTPFNPEISEQPGLGAPPPIASAPPETAVEPAPAAAPAPVAEAEKPVRRSLADLVAEYAATGTADAQHECLAGAVYFEAKGEPLHGQLSVAEVVLNRARSGRFPASVCGVVKQRGQFSFIRGGRFPAIARTSLAWKRAVAIARIAVQDLADGPAPKALFFHAKRVSPRWRLTRVAAVGNHIFYR
ncbi:MAG TPA: cell wall hydrolase [Allosphingosinicella sp.]|jgi:spore germination cell wall hydrolase CwlJ-like protein